MPNDVKLQEGHPVDSHLRPLKVGGKATALEISQSGDGAKITGGLDVIGNINGTLNNLGIISNDDGTLVTTGDVNVYNDLTVSGEIYNSTMIAPTALMLDSLSGDIWMVKDDVLGFLFINIDMDNKFQRWHYGTADHCTLTVAANGATTIATIDSGVGAAGHLNIEADGHVEFDNCAVGFDKLAGVFSTSGVIGDGNDSTDIDFRLGNKYELELTDNISGSLEFLNLIFPATSGNFILVISQDGTGSRTIGSAAWVVYQSDGSTEATNAAFANGPDGEIRWSGGSAPTLTTTADKADIISIYWDADNQTAFAVASLNF